MGYRQRKACSALSEPSPAGAIPRWTSSQNAFSRGISRAISGFVPLDAKDAQLLLAHQHHHIGGALSLSLEQVLSRYGPAISKGAPRLWELSEQWVTAHFLDQSSTR